MTVLWIILACFVLAVVVGTMVAMATKQKADEARRAAPTEPPGRAPPGTAA